MKSFRIDVYQQKDAYSACAFGVMGNWSRNLNSALEDLLNKLLQAGINHLEVMQNEPAEKTPFDVERSNAPGEPTAREDETETGA